MSIDLEDRVENHEHRLQKMEVDSARLDERLDALVKSTNNLKWGMFCFSFIMLLAIIYGALGPKGFNQVVHAPPPIVSNIK